MTSEWELNITKPSLLKNLNATNTMLNEGQEDESKGSLWQIIYTSFVLLIMFIALISDRVGADMVMMTALTLLMASNIISIKEALAGFANEGLLTVLVLFVVAAGISNTGALDWYMGKLLGRPKSAAGAQLKLMIPIAIVSAFLNNTPVVVVMIPIIQRWGKNIGVSPQQLLIPLSFASILGGTCTLIGTSTNLVVKGLLEERYPENEDGVREVREIGLFDLGKFGVPIALAGMTYVLLFSMFLIPGGSRFLNDSDNVEVPIDTDDSFLLGARLTKWSSAVNRTIKRSGLRDTGGVYLVSVHRAATGNVHRAVSNEFVLSVGDVLYFTGLVEGFGKFCEDNGLEVITNEVEDSIAIPNDLAQDHDEKNEEEESKILSTNENINDEREDNNFETLLQNTSIAFNTNHIGRLSMIPEVDVEIGVTKESLVMSEAIERCRYINRIQDLIRGRATEDEEIVSKKHKLDPNAPPKIVANADIDDPQNKLVVVAISTPDRPGLLLDISKTLIRLGLNFHKTEAVVLQGRSLSLWRCEVLESGVSDIEEIWSVMNAMLEVESGVEAVKSRGLRVIRASIPQKSKLISTTAAETNFRKKYKAAIVAVQRDGKSVSNKLSQARFQVGDVLVLQVSDDSPLLVRPPDDFYRGSNKKCSKKRSSSLSRLRKRFSGKDNASNNKIVEASDEENQSIHSEDDSSVGDGSYQSGLSDADYRQNKKYLNEAWTDLTVIFPRGREGEGDEVTSREFLTAFEIMKRSKLTSKTVHELGLDKVPGTFLVSIDRPKQETPQELLSISESDLENNNSTEATMIAVSHDKPLKEGDVLWYSGDANAIGDLRKIPGMRLFVNEEVKKINEKVHDRRLLQAVIARRSKLLGKTVKEARFRTKYGAAVLAVHREGRRVQEHPGNIKLQAGDVLLLEAGPSFFKQNAEKDNSFSLLSEVQDSAPPRLKLLVPALVLATAMLVVYTVNVTSLLVAALVASLMMVSFGILSQQEVRDAINWEVYITIAAAFGIGTALKNSGVAGGVADGLVGLGKVLGLGDAGLYATVYLATFLISNVVTNNAAAALLFPIAMDSADSTGANKEIMAYTLMLGASASFMSPFGYTTNLLIYGPGGYKYADFLRIGTPMQVILWILSIVFVSNSSRWYISWIVTGIVLILTSIFLTFDSRNLCGRSSPKNEIKSS